MKTNRIHISISKKLEYLSGCFNLQTHDFMKTIIISLFLLMLSFPAYACSCMGYEIEEAYQTYEVVFIGKAVSIGEQSFFEGRGLFTEGLTKVRFDVIQTFKGIQENKTFVFTDGHPEACGFSFEKNSEYAIFGYYSKSDKGDKKIYTSICSPTIHTNPKNDTDYELELLGKETMNFLNSL